MNALFFAAALLCSAGDSDSAANAMTFQDAAAYEGRSVLQFRFIDLRDRPCRPLVESRKFDAGTKYGMLPVGPSNGTSIQIAWNPKGKKGSELWVDADGNGIFADDECRAMKDRDLEIPLKITLQVSPKVVAERTVVLKRSSVGDGIRYAVRGYAKGKIALGEKAYSAVLVDGNADALFNTVGQDRVWIDLNEDGRFDPITEQFPLGKPIPLAGEVYVVKSDYAASSVVANLRSVGQGKIRLTLENGLKVDGKFYAELVSDLGELVVVEKCEEDLAVPFGQYSLSSLIVETKDADGKMWNYEFSNSATTNFNVPKDGATTVPLLTNPRMDVSIDASLNTIKPGASITINPKLKVEPSLYLYRCTIEKSGQTQKAEGNAQISLLDRGGKKIAEGITGFS